MKPNSESKISSNKARMKSDTTDTGKIEDVSLAASSPVSLSSENQDRSSNSPYSPKLPSKPQFDVSANEVQFPSALYALPTSETPPTPITSSTTLRKVKNSKHSREVEETASERIASISTLEPPLKRQRSYLKLRHTLYPENAAAGNLPDTPPLRSSLSSSHKLKRSHILSNVDAISMSNRTRDEHSIKTLKLARGKVLGKGTNSPPHSNTSSLQDTTRDRRSDRPWTNTNTPGNSLIESVGILELLELDERPTFIIDVAEQKNYIPGACLRLEYANASLRATEPILEIITGYADLASPTIVTNAFPEFKAWVLSFVDSQRESLDISLPSFLYGGLTWSCSTLRKRLRVISGTLNHLPVGSVPSNTHNILEERVLGEPPSGSITLSSEPSEDYFGTVAASPTIGETVAIQQNSRIDRRSSAEGSSFDWTRLPPSAALPRHVQFTRNFDWASTPLGPIETWSFDLRAMCNLIMGSPHPAAMYWGSEYTTIYNEAYILLAGQKHPSLMGQSYKTAWAEIWDDIRGTFEKASITAEATMKDDDCLFIKRNGYLEESYFAWSIIPLVGEDGSVVGLYNPAWEKTRRVISERRMLTLREVGEKTAVARNLRGFWSQVIKGLEYNPRDIPFALLYSVNDESDSDMSSLHSGSLSQAPSCVLEGKIGVPEGHRTAVTPLDLNGNDDGFAPYLRESIRVDRPILLTTDDGTLSKELIEGLECAGFGDPCRAAVVIPLHATTGESILGFLVMGVNPRRPYDDDYSLFIQLISRQLATSMASVVLFEEEIRRGQRAARLAARDRQELSELVSLRTQEAEESEYRFTRMAEMVPVGIFIANSLGDITFCNDTWWEISRHPRTSSSAKSWMDSIKDEDRDGVRTVWDRLVNQKVPITHEFRFKAPWQGQNATTDTWALMSCAPLTDNNDLKSIFGSITNISHQKWAEAFQRMRMEEAVELKRQQENFIDMTSHEMRNPLSAMLQCSDEIATALKPLLSNLLTSNLGAVDDVSEIVDSCIDAAKTITLCAQHQKRIVDDILTLSKLDSALLMVTPVPVQPDIVAQRVIKMFEGDVEKQDITIEFRMDESYINLGIEWVTLDPSRLLQVLINLLTNAIKFTTGEVKRAIIVSAGASVERPVTEENGVRYFPFRSKVPKLVMDDEEWGRGEDLYLKFAVEDTGRGIGEEEIKSLFKRFSQASPRTHVQYGGSGLGLFISRELTELQGGQIGLTSMKGVGSSFAFYIKARRAEKPPDESPLSTPKGPGKNSLRDMNHSIHGRTNSAVKAVSARSSTSSSKALPFQSVDYKDISVLIVEDNLVNQRVLAKQLTRAGLTTQTANHGVECLESLEKSSFWKGESEDGSAKNRVSCVLMDLEMPIMDGLECARRIRDLESNGTIVRHVPIIAVTANARPEQIKTAIAAGVDDVVSKPFRIPELLPKIEELVAKFQLTSISEAEAEAEAEA